MGGEQVRFYTVELRISGKDLDPFEVSEALGLTPVQMRLAGERRGDNESVFTEGLCAFSTANPASNRNEWPSLEEGLSSTLKYLMPRAQAIASYAHRFNVYWWCGQFQPTFGGGAVLSVNLMRELSDFGVELRLECYES
jgi:hypothetical protein